MDTASAIPADYHHWTVEVWPPNPTGASYPMPLPLHVSIWAPTMADALALEQANCEPGEFVAPGGHVRADCCPRHAWQDQRPSVLRYQLIVSGQIQGDYATRDEARAWAESAPNDDYYVREYRRPAATQ